jgi:hypothetical protein
MSVGATLLTGVIAALAGGIGVVAGALVTNRGQDRHWLRDQQLAAYRDLLGHDASYSMKLNRAHQDRRRWDYDWGAWSTALISASLVAPDRVATLINDFDDALQVLRDAAKARNPKEDPLTLDEIRDAAAPGASAQVRLVNAMRESLGMRERLTMPVGGAPVS